MSDVVQGSGGSEAFLSAGYRGRQRQAGLLRMPLWSDRGDKWVPMDIKRTGAGGGTGVQYRSHWT